MNPILLYFLIFVIKVFEVSLATLRIVLITKNERVKGAFIGFFEVIIWVLIVSTVLTGITEDPFKVVIYALGFAVGNYTGSKLENFFAIGDSSIEVITHKIDGKKMAKHLRANGFAVTSVNAYGMNDKREILYLHVPRKRVPETIDIIRSKQDDVVITIHDIKPVYGGYKALRK
ncbi:DUF2179 domain-containing protein [Candidatus Xianfuyuplasma coldseepsis]|uniref:DUF2179 domain-containing protein n=1 Tax=Candidatus Xianfuyuplasma coldseepsis TaxID=2782163 RepID=A0A7L7KSR7_9MOLU|nr:DUF5698 domain-containing protein [Xianfuyuplasma coldseepsis]QMS85861.1 DUF2179 domain-containing protein [Xianfuyuplasma coldseepsis]